MDLKTRTRWIIDEICTKFNLTNESLAAVLDVSDGTINNYRTKKNFPSAKFIIALKEKYNVNPLWLLLGEGDPIEENQIYANNNGVSLLIKDLSSIDDDSGFNEKDMGDLINKVIEILRSCTLFRSALTCNINAFHQALKQSNRMLNLEKKLNRVEQKLIKIETAVDE